MSAPSFVCRLSADWTSFDWTRIPRATPELKKALAACQRHLLVTVVRASAFASIGDGFRGTIEHLLQTDYVPGSSNVMPPVDAPLIVGNVGSGQMDVDFQGSTEIAFTQLGTNKGEPVVPTLEYLAYSVREIVDLFRSKFF